MTEHVSASRRDWSSDRLLTPRTSEFRQAGLVSHAARERRARLFNSGSVPDVPCFSSLASTSLFLLVTRMEIWRPLQTYLLSIVRKQEGKWSLQLTCVLEL